MTTESTERNRFTRLLLLALLLAVLGIVGVGLYSHFRRPPALGHNEEVQHTVDALFTALTGQDAKRLADCERRLAGYRDTGELPLPAARALESIIQQARNGGWQSAAEQLYDFIQRQKPDRTTPTVSKSDKKPRPRER